MRANYIQRNNKLKIGDMKFSLAKVNLSTVAKIERMGLAFEDFEKRPIAFCVALVAVSIKKSFEEAAALIQNHLDAGGEINSLVDAVKYAVDTADLSGF